MSALSYGGVSGLPAELGQENERIRRLPKFWEFANLRIKKRKERER
jgi:hypothetical protein